MMMIQKLLLGILLAAAGIDLRAADQWKLVWSDEFDYSGLPDPKRWTNEVGFVRNREAQLYTRRTDWKMPEWRMEN
jgi:hypothetical protein